MKTTYKTICLVSLLWITVCLGGCGPSDSELRTELQGIEQEMVVLRTAAYQHQSAMNQAGFDAFIGGFAAGFGTVGGDYELAGEGLGGVVDAGIRSDVAAYSLDQIQQRYNVLAKRRDEIVKRLR